MPPGSKGAYKTSFWADFIHINVAMWSSNNALTPDPDKEPDQLTSTPAQWPLCTVGLRMCGWGDDKHKVFLLGNPIVWWSGFASLLIYCALTFVYLTRQRRGIIDFPPGKFFFVILLNWPQRKMGSLFVLRKTVWNRMAFTLCSIHDNGSGNLLASLLPRCLLCRLDVCVYN